MTSWKKYKNNRCTTSSAKYSTEINIHKVINSALKSKKCVYTTGSSGLKLKASCRDYDTIYLKFYNFFNEDRNCKKSYGTQELQPGLRLPPLTIDNKRCEAFGPGTWIVPRISRKKTTSSVKISSKNQKEIDQAFKNYNKSVDDAASMAVGVLVAIIVGSICAVCLCIACCVYLIRQGNNTTVVVAGDGK